MSLVTSTTCFRYAQTFAEKRQIYGGCSIFKRLIHRAPDYKRLKAMYETDREYNAIACSKMQKHQRLMRRYFEVASVMNRNGKFPFLHAQNSAFRAARHFIETLTEDSRTESYFKYFRMPSKEFSMDRAELIQKISNSNHELSSYIMSMSYSIFESAHEESANHFLFTNTSAAQEGVLEISKEAVRVTLKRYGIQAETPYILKVMDQFFTDYSKLQLGSLYLVGVPKERLSRYVYDSHPYGKPTGIDMQQVIDSTAFSLEECSIRHRIPQARLMFFNETMTPLSGIEVVDVTDAKECARYTKGHEMTLPETEPSYSYFFPLDKNLEEEDEKQKERIDHKVKKFGKLIANLIKNQSRG